MPRTSTAKPTPQRAAAGRSGSNATLAVVEPIAPQRFAVFESKLRIPAVRTGIVSRAGLVNRLRAERAVRLATVIAPSGYGKTTLLAQWAARDERPFAWLTVDPRDNEPVVLLRHLATAFDRIEPLDRAVFDALSTPEPSLWADAAPRLVAAVAAFRTPFVAVLDDADAIHRGDAADVVAALAENVPEGSILVLAGRGAPALRIARLRAGGLLLELGRDELALSRRESLLLLRASGVELEDDDAADLAARSEGWAAGLSLATLALDDGGPRRVDELGGGDRYLADYFWSEILSGLTAERLAFLRRTSVLDRLSGELCDAVLEREDSASELEALARDGLFLVPLDRRGGWYRYHRLFRDVLRLELERREAALVPQLDRRAADWLEGHGDRESALHHALASGDAERAARILTTLALPGTGARIETVEALLERFAADAPVEEHPAVAVLGAWIHALRGRPADAEHWLEHAVRAHDTGVLPDGSASVRPWLALVRAALCVDGVERMAQDVEDALAELPPTSAWRPTALVLQGVARALVGELDGAEESFLAASEAAERSGEPDARMVATAQRSLLAEAAGDHATAERLALEVRAATADGAAAEHVASALAHATAARALLRHGRWDEARSELAAADRLGESLTSALPWLAVQTRTALGAAYLTLRDRDGASAQLAEGARILAARPRLGSLADDVAELRRQVDELPGLRDGHSSGLTGAELRLLPLLATHLSFREIGDRLYVSRNTIKTQAISAYRKLGVSSRSAAIERAAELGLLDAGDAAAGEFIRRG